MSNKMEDKMIYQQFGEITGWDELTEVLLCIDEDRPLEFLITILPQDKPAFAILAFAANLKALPIKLTPRNLLKPQANGGLFYPRLEQSEIQALANSEILLTVGPDGSYSGTWKSEDKTGSVTFHAPQPESNLEVKVLKDWQAFKHWVSEARSQLDVSLFRGHGSNNFTLSTTLHRAGRNRMERYCSEVLSRFHNEAQAELGVRLDMNNGEDYSVVLGLAQHHGLPTPLLDWTESPYIAAFFAFSDALDATHRNDSHVRIFALTRKFVEGSSPINVVLTRPNPFAASLKISWLHNVRLRAQQGRFLITNVGNFEAWLRKIEQELGDQYLYAVDIPIEYATEALQDLAFMGLTAATMFPGLDGICRALRHEMTFTKISTKAASLPASGQANVNQSETESESSFVPSKPS